MMNAIGYNHLWVGSRGSSNNEAGKGASQSFVDHQYVNISTSHKYHFSSRQLDIIDRLSAPTAGWI